MFIDVLLSRQTNWNCSLTSDIHAPNWKVVNNIIQPIGYSIIDCEIIVDVAVAKSRYIYMSMLNK